MTKLLLLTAVLASLAFGQVSLTAQPPPPVTVAGGIAVGARGGSTLYYWVIARYPAGTAQPSAPAVVPNTVGEFNLSVSNYVTVNWSPMPGATGYDVLRSSSPVYPASPSCSCAVVLNTAGTSVNDTGGALSAYPPGGINTAVPVNAYLTINNRDAASPFVNLQLLSLKINEVLRLALIAGTPAENDCMKYTGGRLASSGAPCGSDGGAANLPFTPSRETASSSNDRIRLSCSVAPFCTIRVNDVDAYTTDTDITATLSGMSATGNLLIYYTLSTRTVYCSQGTAATLSVSGCTAATNTSIPAGSVPIGSANGIYTFTNNVFDNPATNPVSLPVTASYSCGLGLLCSKNATTGEVTIATDSTIPTKANIQSGALLRCASADSSSPYTCSMSPTLASYTDGQVVEFEATGTALSGALNLNINSIGNAAIKQCDGSTDPASGDIVVGQQVRLVYDGTSFRLPCKGGANPAGTSTEVQYRAGSSTFGALSGSDITDNATSRQMRITADTNDSACFAVRRADTLTGISMCQGDSGNYPISAPYLNSLGDFHIMRSSVGLIAFKSGAVEFGTGMYLGNPSGATMSAGSASYFSRYNGETTAAAGTAYVRASDPLTTQIDSIASGNLLATAAAGTYRVNTYIHTTNPEGSACTAAVVIGWTYNGGAKTKTVIAAHDLNVDEAASDDVTVIQVDASSAITRAVTDTCTRAGYTYDITFVLERLR